MSAGEARAWIGLGGNVGNVRANMVRALHLLARDPGIRVVKVSALYATPPWGKLDQPDFLNAAAELSTSLDPRGLLEACLVAEHALRRVRAERWGPRTIDLDILAMEGVTVRETGLEIPHPRLNVRAFALAPLADLAPELQIGGRSVAQWLAEADTGGIRRIATAEEWYRPAEG